VKVAVQGFYGQQRTGIPVAVASASMLLNIVLNVLLVGPLGYQGLAIATSISFSINFLLLFGLLCRQYGWLLDREMAGSLVTMTLAAVAMGGVLGTVQALCGAWAGRVTQPVLATYVLACIGLALVIYFGIAWMLRLPEMHAIARRLRARGTGL
jgi:putative peptidoglycan lipid II flippase